MLLDKSENSYEEGVDGVLCIYSGNTCGDKLREPNGNAAGVCAYSSDWMYVHLAHRSITCNTVLFQLLCCASHLFFSCRRPPDVQPRVACSHWEKSTCMGVAPSPESQTSHDSSIFRDGKPIGPAQYFNARLIAKLRAISGWTKLMDPSCLTNLMNDGQERLGLSSLVAAHTMALTDRMAPTRAVQATLRSGLPPT